MKESILIVAGTPASIKVKVSSLVGRALDYAVAKCENAEFRLIGGALEMKFTDTSWRDWVSFSSDWSESGKLIEREKLAIWFEDWTKIDAAVSSCWVSSIGHHLTDKVHTGETLLIAAMRCYVTKVVGDEINIPETLIGGAV